MLNKLLKLLYLTSEPVRKKGVERSLRFPANGFICRTFHPSLVKRAQQGGSICIEEDMLDNLNTSRPKQMLSG